MHDPTSSDDELEPETLRFTPKESGVYPSGTASIDDEDTGPVSLRYDQLEMVRSATLARQREERFTGVVRECTDALRAEPGMVSAYGTRAEAKSALGDHAGAIEDYDFALAIAPDDAGLYLRRGDAKTAMGDAEGAVEDYGAAIALDPTDPRALYKRGSLRFARDPEGAIADWERADELTGPLENMADVEALARKLAGS